MNAYGDCPASHVWLPEGNGRARRIQMIKIHLSQSLLWCQRGPRQAFDMSFFEAAEMGAVHPRDHFRNTQWTSESWTLLWWPSCAAANQALWSCSDGAFSQGTPHCSTRVSPCGVDMIAEQSAKPSSSTRWCPVVSQVVSIVWGWRYIKICEVERLLRAKFGHST